MKIVRLPLLIYVSFLSLFIALGAATQIFQTGNLFFFLLFLPVLIHFVLNFIYPRQGHKLVLYYNFILTTIMATSGFLGARNSPELISAFLFLPLALYFWLLVLPKRIRLFNPEYVPTSAPIPISATNDEQQPSAPNPETLVEPETKTDSISDDTPKSEFDVDRRTFIKLIGSAGLAFFLFSLFTKKAEHTFFGTPKSVPGGGSGPVTLVDRLGNPVDPAAKNPTDGYKITEIDDSAPTYFGFLNKDGKWFIMQETDSGSFRYTRGDSNFSLNWPNRAKLEYHYFSDVF